MSYSLSTHKRKNTVVHLKGGDPLVFARTGEELLALARAGLCFDIVPGISSALYAPLVLGVPLTHRTKSTSFAVFTAHEAADGTSSGIDWNLAANAPTAIFLMGIAKLPSIVKNLIEYGRNPNTLSAVVSKASWGSEENFVEGRLIDINSIVYYEKNISAPSVFIVGDVLELSQEWRHLFRGNPNQELS